MYQDGREKKSPETGLQSCSSTLSFWYGLAVVSETFLRNGVCLSGTAPVLHVWGSGPNTQHPYSPAPFKSLISVYGVCRVVYN